MRVTVLAAALAMVIAHDAVAQTTVGVAVGGSRQEAGASDIPYLGPPFGGTAVGIVGLIDRHLAGNTTVGGEVSAAGAISGDQSQRTASATNTFTSRHRDTLFSGVFKIGTPLDGRIHAAFAVGGGLAYRRTARDGTTAPLVPPSVRSSYSAVVSDFVPALSLGGDVDVRVTARLRILALARWHRLRDDDLDANGVVKRGVSSTIFRAGAGAAWRF